MKLIKYTILCFLILFLVSGCVKEVITEEEEEMPEKITEEEAQAEEEVPGIVSHTVRLTKDKTMVPDSIQIKKGEAVKWVNEDKSFYHNIIIYPADIERPAAKDVIVQSGNIAPEDSWEYLFEESGSYAVKDIYSGTMRGEITAEATAELISEGKVIGTINVS
jgi:plastocyanin